MDSRQLEKKQREIAEVTSCDPHTVIAQAKSDLYAKGQNGEPVSPWLEEVVSRFEQTTRAGLGASSPSFAGISGGRQSS